EGEGGVQMATGAEGGMPPLVRTFHQDGRPRQTFPVYATGFTGGVRVAACDLDGDGRAEIVTGAGPGGGPHVRVGKLGPDGSPAGEPASFYAYAAAFTGGVYVACGDIEGTGSGLIVTGADAGGGPHVRVFRLQAGAPGGVVEVLSFFAYHPAFVGGVRVAVGRAGASARAAIVVG